ncbi:MAG TPA: helix-turn-helix transcriptional regulator [Candidatus Deferrimicrobiaceae bacterium]|nr:helix-turn-helix transcriptional regulator [Candidatus Deferrimicrobiaceae bacterium]
MPSRPKEDSPRSTAVAERVQAILAVRRLTLYRVSQQSLALYGRSSPHFVPHNLYYDLRDESFSPSIHQIFTLSRISGYRLRDWLEIFGFDVEDITRLQVLLPAKRTIVIDTSLTDSEEWTPWFRNRTLGGPTPPIAPLTQLLELTPATRIGSVAAHNRRFLYAKIGREDALAFPDLVPGSIVRVNRDITADVVVREKSTISDRFYLIEHGRGFFCCRIRFLANGVIVPFDNGLSYAQVELRSPEEAKVWGAVDFEFRPLLDSEEPRVPKDLARHWKPQLLLTNESFGQLLKSRRKRSRLSVREAAGLSRTVSEILDDDRYTISPSSLSDYELRDVPPRNFHKIITLCSIYGLQLESAMRRLGVDLSESGTDSMPDRFLSRGAAARVAPRSFDEILHSGFLEKLLNECQNEVPFFLRDLLGYFSGFGHTSIDDFFWMGGDNDPLNPYLSNSVVVILNRHRKTPVHFIAKPVWHQPIFLVLTRDGRYFAGCCGIENDKLVVHPYGQDFHRGAEYRYHRDAEVMGQIVAIARKLS